MKKASLLLLIFISLTAFTCENEALDFEAEEAVNSNTNTNPALIVGTWQAVSLEATAESTITIAGVSTQSLSTIQGSNMDYRVILEENGMFTSEGSYDLITTVTADGVPPQTYTYPIESVEGSGTYQITGNMISFSNSFYDLQVGGTGTTTGQDSTPTQSEYSISADGQTLTIIQNDTQTQSEQGIEITANISGVSVFTRL
ncbi:hypothetical protein C8N46_10547 [Kordia periserrulae]|uniref:Lipocalin-like protein n=1 Tax=Kordia periserrulae TaxID=701523 RepID=A0A2T6BXT2_9FLAO|nr:hypothetical protein [Kordia periserrulae]PTX60891.1 hypothetical protein C8N46_10547 [Kordia periserrulae]